MSIVVNQVTSPWKSIVLLQLQTNFSPFFPQRNKKRFNCEGRGHSYKECAFLYGTHKEREGGGGRGGGRGRGKGGSGQGGGCGGHGYHVTLNFC